MNAWTATCQASLSITNSWSLLKLISIESVMPSNHLILCHPLLLPPSIFPSIRVFSNKSALHIRWPKYWSFSFNISPSNEHPGLISFRMDWLYVLAVQGTLKSLLQHHSSKSSILRHSGQWKCSVMMLQWWSHIIIHLSKPIEWTSPWVNSDTNYGLCVMITCVSSWTVTTVIDSGTGFGFAGAVFMRTFSTFIKFWYEPWTALKLQSLFKNMES